MTNKPETLVRAVVRSSVKPSLKYSCFGSSLMLSKGRTTMEGLSDNGNAAGVVPGLRTEDWGLSDGRERYRTVTIPPTRSTNPTPAQIERAANRDCRSPFDRACP